MKNLANKTAKTNPRKKSSKSPAGSYSLPTPITTEKFLAPDGERMTRLTFGPPFSRPVVHSADRFFKDALECHEMLVDPLVWFIIKPWLKNAPPALEVFWRAFNTPESIQERKSATAGIKSIKWQKELVLIQMAHATRRIITSQDDTHLSSDRFPLDFTLMCRMAEWVMNAIESDHEAPRRLYQLLKDPSAADDKTNREMVNRGVFDAFADYIAKEQQLPTKECVRRAAFLGTQPEGIQMASRAFRELGLSGLPTG